MAYTGKRMQVIQSYKPPSYSAPEPQRPMKKRSGSRRRKVLAAFVVVAAVALAIVLWSDSNKKPAKTATPVRTGSSTKTVAPAPAAQARQPQRRLKTFTDAQFKDMVNNFNFPNTEKLTAPPSITGNGQADQSIRSIAEKRGYLLRPQAVGTLSPIEGQKLQTPVIEPYKQLKAAAAQAGLDLNIVSGYRSPTDQRGIFLAQMKAKGVTADMVAAGQADAQIDAILKVNSIPGYSRHHTGYTMDFQCAGSGLDNFMNTPCFPWLSANNYEHAKTYGFIPSYPDGATGQGPDPEQWEYVWVGTDVLYETVR